MSLLRPNLRRIALLWLLCQSLALTTLVGADCCPDHAAAASRGVECQGDAHDICPMAAVTGQECPMHAGGGARPDECVMRGLCNAPGVALSALLPVPGILPPQAIALTVDSVATIWFDSSNPLDAPLAHDTPPPRL